MLPLPGQREQIDQLRQHIARLEGTIIAGRNRAISSGFPALDAALPDGGFRCGTLVEWLTTDNGSGGVALALLSAAQACRQHLMDGKPKDDLSGTVVVLDCLGEFYPPAAVQLGIDARRLIVVRPGSSADHSWALDQALRCPGVAAVVAWPGITAIRSSETKTTARKASRSFSDHTFRRLQLAVECGGGLGLLIRPRSALHEPSWADVRLLAEPLPTISPYGEKRRLRLLLLRCRGGNGSRTIEVEIDDETHCLRECPAEA